MSEQWFERDPLWFKRAVFYEIHLRGFSDGSAKACRRVFTRLGTSW